MEEKTIEPIQVAALMPHQRTGVVVGRHQKRCEGDITCNSPGFSGGYASR